MSDDAESQDPEEVPEVEESADSATDSVTGAVVHLNDIIAEAEKDKRSIDELLQDQRSLAQMYSAGSAAESVRKMLFSWQGQNSALLSAVSALNSGALDSIRTSVAGQLNLTQSAFEAVERARGASVAQLVQDAFGAVNGNSLRSAILGNWLNQPSFATGTQRFLATTEDLRYKSSGTVWHYTSGYVLMQVLSKHYLWASMPHNLNDSSEVKHGLDIIETAYINALREADNKPEYVEKGKNFFSNVTAQIFGSSFMDDVLNEIYIISASGSKDSLTLWRNYSKGDGFAIGLNPGVPLSADGIPESPDDRQAEDRDGIPPIRGWYKVVYSDKKKKELADQFAANALEDIRKAAPVNRERLFKEQRKHILILASIMKHKAFQDENEIRWITTNWMPTDMMPRGSVVHYEHTPQGIVSVLHVRTAAEDVTEDEGRRLPIRAVRCSPVSREGIERTIEGLLVQRGYDAASEKVSKSDQPYKG